MFTGSIKKLASVRRGGLPSAGPLLAPCFGRKSQALLVSVAARNGEVGRVPARRQRQPGRLREGPRQPTSWPSVDGAPRKRLVNGYPFGPPAGPAGTRVRKAGALRTSSAGSPWPTGLVVTIST